MQEEIDMAQSLSMKHQIGQRLMVGFPGTEMTEDFISLIKEYKVGNVILFAGNIQSRQQMIRLCADIQTLVKQETGHDAMIGIDQEGGVVSRLPQDCTCVPGAMALASTGKPELAYEAAYMTGSQLRALGANFNLAPVLDINSNPANPVIGTRSYGDKPEMVIAYSSPTLKAYDKTGVLSCGKHFPGHGDTHVDSHLALPQVDKTMQQLWENELLPFQAAVKAGIPAIMTSHILFPKVDAQYPATLSKTFLTDLLRDEMGFEGLIVTDCMEMKAIQNTIGTSKGAVRAMQAGADMICISHTAQRAREVVELALEMVEAGQLDTVAMQQAVDRILQAKAWLAAGPKADASVIGSDAYQQANRSIMEKTIVPVRLMDGKFPILGEKPMFVGCENYRATLVSNDGDSSFTFAQYMADTLGGQALVCAQNPDEQEIAQAVQQAKGASSIVVATYNGHVFKGQLAMANALADTGIPTTVIALRNPYDLAELDERISTVAAFEYTRLCFDVLADMFNGKLQPTAKLSVTL